MTNEMRMQLEELIDQAWELHDQAQTKEEKEVYAADIMNFLSKLPENELIVKHMELPQNAEIMKIRQ